MMKKRDEKETMRVVGALLVFFACLAGILLYIFTNGRETHIEEETTKGALSAIDCKAGGIADAFFASSTANTLSSQIKVTFSGDKVSKLFYAYEGVYRDYDLAEQDNAVLHAKYNKYMGGNGQDHEILTPTFSTVNTKLRINLYAKDRSMINRVTAPLFFIDSNALDEFLEYSRDQVIVFYEKQGFSCEKQN